MLRMDMPIRVLVELARGSSVIRIPLSDGMQLEIDQPRVDYHGEGGGRKYVFTSRSDPKVRVTFTLVIKAGKTGYWELTRRDGTPLMEGPRPASD